jgi:hypothetical protein
LWYKCNAQYNVFLGSFPTSHSATVEELHKGEYEVGGGGCIPLEILDTSGKAYIDCFSFLVLFERSLNPVLYYLICIIGSFEFPAMRRLAISTGMKLFILTIEH